MRTALLLAALLVPVPLAAQGLGDAAARERKKREETKAPPPARVFTDQDLPGSSSRGASSASGAEGSAGSVTPRDSGSQGPEGPADSVTPRDSGSQGPEGSAVPAGPAPADPSDKEREDRKLLEAEWRVRFANAREELARAEAASWREVVRTDFYQGVPVQMKVKEQVETQELKTARRALADLEEEFRRTGLPPGWTRER